MNRTEGLIVFALAALYAVKCITALDGPLDVFCRIRRWALIHYPASLGKMLLCPWCTGFWVGLLSAACAAALLGFSAVFVVPLGMAFAAVSGCLLEDDNEHGEME